MLDSLTGFIKEFSCGHCGFNNMAVFTSRRHSQKCPCCNHYNLLEVTKIEIQITEVVDGDQLEAELQG